MSNRSKETNTVMASVVNLPSAKVVPNTLDSLSHRLTRQLQTSLQVDDLLLMFNEGLNEIVQVDSYAYICSEPSVRHTRSNSGSHSARYNLQLENRTLGELVFYRKRRFDEVELEIIESLVGILIFPLRNALLYRSALNDALTDAMTGAGNKRSLDCHLHREVSLAKRHNYEFSLLMFDVDFFKRVNDAHGHAAGDAVLKKIVQVVKDHCRDSDWVFRFGGEEFVVVLSKTAVGGAQLIGERIRAAIENTLFCYGSVNINSTVSIGAATYLRCESKQSLIERADKALYEAKQGGRNRMHISEQNAAAEVSA